MGTCECWQAALGKEELCQVVASMGIVESGCCGYVLAQTKKGNDTSEVVPEHLMSLLHKFPAVA